MIAVQGLAVDSAPLAFTACHHSIVLLAPSAQPIASVLVRPVTDCIRLCVYRYLYTLLCSECSVASTHCEPGCLCTEQNNTAGCVSIAIRWLCCRPSSSGLCSSILRELCVPIWRLASLWSHASQCDVQLNGKRANSDDWLPALCSSCTFNVGVLLGELCNHRNQCTNPWSDH